QSISDSRRSEEWCDFKQVLYSEYYSSLIKKWTKNIQNDEFLKYFILRMPCLSNINESLSLFRIPYASRTGLAGVMSKIVKPFYQPNIKIENPNDDEIGNKQIFLGHIISESNHTKYSNSAEYTIRVK